MPQVESIPQKRVVVTGIGIISPAGLFKDTSGNLGRFWDNIKTGRSFIEAREIALGTTYQTLELGAFVDNLDELLDGYVLSKQIRNTPRHARLSLLSALQALLDSRIIKQESLGHFNLQNIENPEDLGFAVGIAVGGDKAIEEATEVLLTKGPDFVSRRTIPGINANKSSTEPAKFIYVPGRNDKEIVFGEGSSVAAACASGSKSILDIYRQIKTGDIKVGLAGGTESPLEAVPFAGFHRLGLKGVLAKYQDYPNKPATASRPFDKGRTGLVMGEGSASLVLEELEHAKSRDVTIYAEILGGFYGLNSRHEVEPEIAAEVKVMQLAFRKAKIPLTWLNYINAHAAGTIGDITEIRAAELFLGKHASNVAMSSTKSMIAHCMGAAGAIEAATTILSIHEGVLPPTANLDNPEETVIDLVPHIAKQKRILIAASNSFGLDGVYLTLVMGKYPDWQELEDKKI